MNIFRSFTTAIVLLFSCLSAGCNTPPDSPSVHFSDTDSLIHEAVNEEGLPGAVLLVAQKEDILFHKAYGSAQKFAYKGIPLEHPVQMTTAHQFDLASLTKVLATTFGIMLLLDDGEIELDNSIKAYLPAFSGPSKDSVTVRHLLSHTAGLYPWKPTYYHATNRDETYAYISNLDLASPVGKQRAYSDLGFMLLGYIIESISDQPLDVFLHHRLYNPLGLTRTAFTPNAGPFAATSHGNPFEKRMVADDSFGYVCDEDPESFTGWRLYTLKGEVNDGNAYHAHQGIAGHAGLFSTSEEIHALLTLLLNNGAWRNQQLIQSATVTEFLTPSQSGHGLGWAMAAPALPVTDPPEGSFGHTGFTGTFVVAIPEQDLSIVLLTNRQQTDVGQDGRYMSLTTLRKNVVAAILNAL